MRNFLTPTKEEPYEFERVLEQAVQGFLNLEDEGSKWRGLSTDREVLKGDLRSRQKRLMQYQQLIEPRSIGLFIGKHFGDLERFRPGFVHHAELSSERIHLHKLSAEEFAYAQSCAEKYMPVVVAFRELDSVIASYFTQLDKSFLDLKDVFLEQVERHSQTELNIIERVIALNFLTKQFHALKGELAPFYVMEMEKQGVKDILDIDAHYSVLNAILRKEPLSDTFLSSARNDFGKCPFHAITRVFSHDYDAPFDGDVTLKDAPKRGALMPFVMKQITRATGRQAEVQFVSGLPEMRAELG